MQNDLASTHKWTTPQLFLLRAALLFIPLFSITFPLPSFILPPTAQLTAPLFETLAKFTARLIFNSIPSPVFTFQSDSTALYIHAFNLLIIALVAAFVWGLLIKKKGNPSKLLYGLHTFTAYYLGYVLLVYGFSKIFKWQFYLPEPNILYTPIGKASPDLLFWSVMGVSYPYTVFSGIIEIIPALLLFFRQTRLLGALIALAVLINVSVLNFSFDISVKLFSCFLLLLCMVLVAPHIRTLHGFFIKGKPGTATLNSPVFSKNKFKVYAALKILLIIWLAADALYPYVSAGNFNDDTAARPALHGAYEVDYFILNSDTLPPLLTDTARWMRVFVHRRGYFITQKMNGSIMDYEIAGTDSNYIFLRDYYILKNAALRYNKSSENELLVDGILFGDTLTVHLKKTGLEQLPALQSQFHWTIEE